MGSLDLFPLIFTPHIYASDYTLSGREDVVTAIRNIELTESSSFPAIRRGEFVMVRGPSGGGKSTLLNLSMLAWWNGNWLRWQGLSWLVHWLLVRLCGWEMQLGRSTTLRKGSCYSSAIG